MKKKTDVSELPTDLFSAVHTYGAALVNLDTAKAALGAKVAADAASGAEFTALKLTDEYNAVQSNVEATKLALAILNVRAEKYARHGV